MLTTVCTFDALLSEVQLRTQKAREIYACFNSPIIITFDGWAAAGKTCNAYRVSRALNYYHVDLDDYINGPLGTILEHVRYTELYSELSSATDSILFSGACIQAILRHLNIDRPIVKVYVKRMSGDIWADSDRIYPEGDMTIEQFWLYGNHNPREREMAKYHQQFRPDETSDICYLRSS